MNVCIFIMTLAEVHFFIEQSSARHLSVGVTGGGALLMVRNVMAEGWVRLHRVCIENNWLKNHKLWVFWTYCLLKASYRDYVPKIKFQNIPIKAGEFIFGLHRAAEDTGLSVQSIRTCIDYLKKSKNLTIKTTNKFSVVTITNWTLYQSDEDESTSNPTNKQQTSNKQVTTYNNNKNNKNNKNKSKSVDLPSDFDAFIRKFFNEYVKMVHPRSTTRLDSEMGAVRTLLNLGYDDISEYYRVMEFLNRDTFWQGNIHSFAKLVKIKDGVRYFDKMLSLAHGDRHGHNNQPNRQKSIITEEDVI